MVWFGLDFQELVFPAFGFLASVFEKELKRPYNAGFDVRISDEWFNRENPIPPTFHTKKQID
jgi:hypothetical protein